MTLSDYERQREKNIARNALMLKQLGLTKIAKKKPQRKAAPKKKFRRPAVRKSARAQNMPAPVYDATAIEILEDEHLKDVKKKRSHEAKQGYRTTDGRWRGERWGEVKGVEPGTCFGRGDFQRKGRQEMSDTGFFKPFVDPEWKDSNKRGCYAIILNNDNSTSGSKDLGDVVMYAGSGGRNRGQNRMAPQSFSQSFENATNAALRRNCDDNRPVRVIRGPKLSSKFGTIHDEGGFRYDGLYNVVKAELVPSAKRKNLLTAMFTLERVGKGGSYAFKSLPAPASTLVAPVTAPSPSPSPSSSSFSDSEEEEEGHEDEDEDENGGEVEAMEISEGARIEAKFDDSDVYYPGVVTRVNTSHDPGTSGTSGASKAKKMGARGRGQSAATATATATTTATFAVRFDDGDVDNAVPVGAIRLLAAKRKKETGNRGSGQQAKKLKSSSSSSGGGGGGGGGSSSRIRRGGIHVGGRVAVKQGSKQKTGRVAELRHPSWQAAEERTGGEPRWRIRVEYDSDESRSWEDFPSPGVALLK